MKRFAITFLMLVTLGCAFPAMAKIKVVTTSADLAYFARAIGGEDAEVSSILKGFQDPHFAAAKPSYMVAVSRADLLLSIGLDLEIGWLPLIVQGARNPDIMPGAPGFLDCSQFVTPIEIPAAGVDRSKGDLHPKGNPHYWLDPVNARAVASGIAGRMGEILPDAQPRFQQNLKRLRAEIDQAETEARQVLASGEKPPIVTYHVTYSYFLNRFGLSAAAFVEPKPGIPPSPSHVASLVIRLKGFSRPAVILVEPYYDQDIAKDLAAQTGARWVVTPSSIGGGETASTYRELLVSIAHAIVGR